MKIRGSKYLLLCFLFLGTLAKKSFSQDHTGPMVLLIYPERQKERRQSRWTLSDWMKTRQTMDAQDRWLWSHTNKVPIDVTLGWDVSAVRQGFEADVYLTRIGLRLRYEEPISYISKTPTDLDLQGFESDLQFRLFGGNIQDTNLILRASYHYANLTLPSSARGHFTGFGIGPELQIYFAQWLGVRGDYEKLLNQSTRTGGTTYGGSSYSYAAFLEMGSLRGEFGYRSKTIEYTKGATGSENEAGLFGRLRLFF
jgi:hypothetical protein